MSKILLTTDTDLTAVADAIRAKNETIKALVYPEDYIIGIRSISAASASGNSSISVSDAEDGDICSLTQYGVCEQDSSTNAISCNNGVLSISNGEVVATAANSETLTLGSQTATVENLYSVGSVRDEQEITTGRIIRKNAVCIYDETQNVGDRYLSSTGAKDNGAIVVYPMETEYNGQSNVTFTEDEIKDINLLEASISPIQDLHGYSNPWPGGGGKNIMPTSAADTKTNNGVTIATTGNGVYTFSGTALTGTTIDFDLEASLVIPVSVNQGGNGAFFLFNTSALANGNGFVLLNGGTTVDTWGFNVENKSSYGYSAMGGKTINKIRFTIIGGTNVDGFSCSPMFTNDGSTSASAFIPYSNICPISGRTGLSVYVSPTQDPDDATVYNVDWSTQAGTVYGGTVDVVTGVLTVEYIKRTVTSVTLWGASNPNGTPVYAVFNGTSNVASRINKNMMKSNIFTYSKNNRFNSPLYGYGCIDGGITTQTFILPSSITTKAEADAWFANNPTECVFKLATPLTYQLTSQEVVTLVGQNNIFSSDATSIKVAVSNPVIERVAPQPFTLNSGSNTISANNLSVSSVPLKIAYNAQ